MTSRLKKKEKVESAENRKKYHQNTERAIYPVAPVIIHEPDINK